MNHALDLAGPVLAGVGIGLFFYGGLWFTVARITSGRGLWLLLGASFIIRTVVALGALWWVAHGSAARVALCFAGFILARPLVARLTRKHDDAHQP